MAQCRNQQCKEPAVAGSAYCKPHKGGTWPNVVMPSVPAAVAVRQDLAQAQQARATPPAARSAPAPGHRRRGAIDLGATSIALTGQAQNMNRMRVAHAAQLAKTVSEPEYLKPLIEAMHEITQSPAFAKYLDREVGWTNASAWFDWAARAIAPDMMARPVAAELRDQLRWNSLLAGRRGKVFADRYFFELSLYCDAAIEKMDISFIFGQASMVFGPLLAPILAIPAAAAHAAAGSFAGTATSLSISAGKALAETGIKAGAKAALVTAQGQKTVRKYENLNPMRFTLAWLDFVSSEKEPSKAIALVHAEFGGAKACDSLYEFIKSSNL